MDSKFGVRLKTLRKEKNMTQEELAKLLNVHKGTISNWENGYRFPEERILIKLAEIFDKFI
jgi:transcriptional regulator with XRE-family HTH domain